MILQAFNSGKLLLQDVPSGVTEAAGAPVPISASILVAVFVILMILLLRTFLQLLPFIADSLLRARGSAALENSVRVSRDRNTVALVMMLPGFLLAFRYRLYDPSFIAAHTGDTRLWLIGACFTGYLFLRLIIYLLLKPRRRYENYQVAHHASYTFFIILVLLALLTAGVLSLFRVPDTAMRLVLYVETAVVYLVFLIRRSQILSLSCNHFRTFLYLCALELIPSAALIVSAVLL
ncbi:MAG: hypothetical protein J5745_05970 [Bacteroidales bacterium]|nr:hypothetical protein [Bacteroidales bacterium]